MSRIHESNLDRTRLARQKSRMLLQSNRIQQTVDETKRCAKALESYSDRDLVSHTNQLRRFQSDASKRMEQTQFLALSAAAVVEALRRVMGLRLFDVQIRAGVMVSHGAVAEMQTGEGKTLSGAIPAYVHALSRRGVHVVTTNAYLAERDRESLDPVFQLLGISTGVLLSHLSPAETRAAYRADVTYGPGYAFGFDYLKDQLTLDRIQRPRLGHRVLTQMAGKESSSHLLQRGLNAAIIDEVDHVLIDDAVSPMILTFGSDEESPDSAIHREAKCVADHLVQDADFLCTGRHVELTDHGFRVVYASSKDAVRSQLLRPWHEYVVLALKAKHALRRDIDYVLVDDEIRIVDPSTGRIFEDRKWSDGLHQAVEARESMRIRSERVAEAKITRQRFYRQYRFLAGMTGTAAGCEREFASVYGMPIAVVPLRRSSRRLMLAEHHSLTRTEKMTAIGSECEAMVGDGRSVLVGTLSIAESLEIASELQGRGLRFELLNGIQDADEASIVAGAGQPGAITVATNLAGRGTDIKLHADVAKSGGLHVIVAQPHSLSRVDRQLVGRCARCGDPGSARVFVCAEDSPAKDHAPWIRRALQRWDRQGRKQSLELQRRLQKCQDSIQRQATAQRWSLLESDCEDERLLTNRNSPQHCFQLA
ncbi:MAG: preprotein translocase subunit SecA [Planctomycetota bacterium]